MGDIVELSQMSLTQRLLKQKAERARLILAQASTAATALVAGRKLVGSYANLRPPDPDQFALAIAEVLAQYPAGLVEECVNVTTGIARKVEFLSIKSLTEWLDNRLAFHRNLASYRPSVPSKPLLPEPVMSDEHRERMALALRGLARGIARKMPIDDMDIDQLVELGRA